MTTADGTILDLPLGPTGFDGYLEISGGGLTPTLYFPNPVITAPRSADDPFDVNVLASTNLDLFAQLAGLTLDPAAGYVGARALDCGRRATADVQASGAGLGDAAAIVYLVGGLPDPAATATDVSGVVGIFNVAPGAVTLESRNAEGQNVANLPVQVRAGFLTTTDLAPTP